MKIDRIDITVFERPVGGSDSDTLIKGQSIMSLLKDLVAVRVVTDEGVTGEVLSLGGGQGLAHYMAATIRPALVGQNPLEREAIWYDLWDLNRLWFTPLFVLGTIDVALWDLYGKWLGRPIHEILGTYRTKIPAYASSMTKGSVDEFVKEAVTYQERGYQGYKLHVFGDPDRDIEACQAVRTAVGDEWPLMIDVVSAYDQYQALRVGRALEELDFYWYEEPLRDYDTVSYRKLSDALDIPVAAGEVNEGGLYTVPDYVSTGAVDILRADPSFKCGIGQTKKIAAVAEAFGMNCEIHTNPNPVLDAAALHCALSIKNTTFFEQLVPEHLFADAVDEPVRIDNEGFAHAPDGPGLGVNIDWDYVERNKIAEL